MSDVRWRMHKFLVNPSFHYSFRYTAQESPRKTLWRKRILMDVYARDVLKLSVLHSHEITHLNKGYYSSARALYVLTTIACLQRHMASSSMPVFDGHALSSIVLLSYCSMDHRHVHVIGGRLSSQIRRTMSQTFSMCVPGMPEACM